MRKLLFILAAVFLAGSLFAYNLTVTVLVKDRLLPDATVAVAEKKLSDMSDDSGRVLFKDIPAGKYTIIGVAAGYEKAVQEINISNADLNINLNMTHIVFEMGEVTVSGKRNRGKVSTETSIHQDEIKKTVQGFMNDSARVIQAMPGVSSSGSTFDSAMYIQGGANYEWIAAMDGVFILNPNRWGGRISMFNPNIVDTINLYTAGYPAQFGQGLSGVIMVNSKNANNEKWKGFVDLSAATLEVLAEGPISSNVTFLFNFRRTFYDFIAPLFMSGDSTGVQFPYLWDGIMKINWDITPNDTLSFMAYGSLEGMNWKMSGSSDGAEGTSQDGAFFYEDWNTIASLKYNHEFGNEDAFDIIVAGMPRFGKYRLSGSPTFSMDFDSKEYDFQLAGNYYLNSIKGNKFQTGFAAIFALGEFTGVSKSYYLNTLGVWTNQSFEEKVSNICGGYAGAYIMDNWEILPSIILEAGIRGEYYSRVKSQAYDPQCGIKFELSKEWDVYFRSGLYQLFPMEFMKTDPTYGNADLTSEKVIHYIGGIDFSDKNFSFRLEGFYKNYYDLIEDDSDYHYNNHGVRNVYGGDVYLQKKAVKGDWVSGWLAYTYVNGLELVTERSPEKIDSPYPTPLNTWFMPTYLRAHTLSTLLELTYNKNDGTPWLNWMDQWRISFDFRALSGKAYTPVTNFISSDIPGVGTMYYFQNGGYNSAWTPPVLKLDIKVTFQGSPLSLLNIFGINIDSTSYISFINVFNNENITDYAYSIKNGQLQQVAIKDFPFMVLGGFRVDF
jgi:hypothetical protein